MLAGYNLGSQRECRSDVSPSSGAASQDRSPEMRYKSIPNLTTEQQDRFWSKVEVHQPAGCWEWTSGINDAGYGIARFGASSNQFRAHRVAYELLVGEITDGYQLDHLCRNRSCVNPDHLDPVPQRENLRRGFGQVGLRARLTHCKHGHEFTPENTGIQSNGCRKCKACDRERSRRRAA